MLFIGYIIADYIPLLYLKYNHIYIYVCDLTYPSRFLLTAIDLTISHYIPIVAVLTYPSEFLLTAFVCHYPNC
jgi:hypothetical protein